MVVEWKRELVGWEVRAPRLPLRPPLGFLPLLESCSRHARAPPQGVPGQSLRREVSPEIRRGHGVPALSRALGGAALALFSCVAPARVFVPVVQRHEHTALFGDVQPHSSTSALQGDQTYEHVPVVVSAATLAIPIS